MLEQLHSERFVDDSPAQVYATLLDEGTYLASERTMYRILAAQGQSRERRAQLRHPAYVKPELLATGPNQLWSWDITKLKGPVKWTTYALYVLLDVFSRYVPGWLLAQHESGVLADRLISSACVPCACPACFQKGASSAVSKGAPSSGWVSQIRSLAAPMPGCAGAPW